MVARKLSNLLQPGIANAQSHPWRIVVVSCCGRTAGPSCALRRARRSLLVGEHIREHVVHSSNACTMQESMPRRSCRVPSPKSTPPGTSRSAPPLRGEPRQRWPAPDMLINFDSFLSYVCNIQFPSVCIMRVVSLLAVSVHSPLCHQSGHCTRAGRLYRQSYASSDWRNSVRFVPDSMLVV